ncbi:16S rRNA m(2)G-966 methyltransferase [Fontimonas thermophila]|uniref:Ribosomal RNA small subunit methyltransferase D n=1 Tax=Fontimonas thermophila TaxID=1076937 RepID=A0A1I2KBT6_9GAMM|nr:16S rRNA (guanine(966)-N(2))-methyltransferase RsmD [Fontimonas thermophila]SFF63769.1 16S rRNA m(2)G-966 methyltransferase [Fontimonas thermophila]
MATRTEGKLRVIGGQWRSRIIDFDARDGVRATPDRVRQTVFDWLAPVIEGARCLDLFAGSGAMGIEALSRGAAHCTFVEQGSRQCTRIKAALLALKAQHTDVVMMDAIYFLQQTWHRYHVVFLDPPFESDLLGKALDELPKVLHPSNRIFLEWPARKRPELPERFEWLREKQAGQVGFGLVTYRHPVEQKK